MSEKFTLAASKRASTKHSAREARAQRLVPGIVYGHGTEPQSVSVGASEILRLYRKAGQASVIELDIEGTKHSVLIHDMNVHPVRMEIHHIDFLAVNPKEKTMVHVPVTTEGEAPAVKNFGGILMLEHDTIDVRCLPADIPHHVTLNVSTLENLGDHLCVKDLPFDLSKHEIMNLDPEAVVVSIAGKKSKDDEDGASETAAVAAE
jgi:large subunit ribosomal protein L25